MKIKFWIFLFLIVLFFNSFSQNYTIKKRWTINSSYSLYSSWKEIQAFIMTEAQFNDPNYYWRKQLSNIRLNVNYGISNCFEIGGYIGIAQYTVIKSLGSFIIPIDSASFQIEYDFIELQKFAPTFGININFHLLPILKIDPRCKWDLYISVKYGGCYFITYHNNINYFIPISSGKIHKDELYAYRHEYGVGIGGSVFFWNLIGFNTEFSVGQFSYWPRLFSSNFNLRAGIILKLNANRNKIFISD